MRRRVVLAGGDDGVVLDAHVVGEGGVHGPVAGAADGEVADREAVDPE